jgi:hypothetical protein
MKSIAFFDAFLADEVNLKDTRIDQLDNSFEAIKKFIRGSDYAPKLVSFYKHGSWAHRTIIRPLEGNPFDADIIMFVKPVEGWTAAQYLNELARIFRNSATYKDKIRVYSYCVTIEYAGDRKMDIAPCVVDREAEDTYEVCNRNDDEFRRTEPEKYTAWINDKNASSGRNSFRKVTRLLKYVRDVKTTFTCPSFLLTTLLGMQIWDGDKDNVEFADLPTALRTMIARLDDWLQAHLVVPSVSNPVLSSEDQASGWTDTQYANFRTQIHRYRDWVDDAYLEQDSGKSLTKWRKIFGDDFGQVRKAAVASVESIQPAANLDDVDLVRKRGLIALSESILAPSWRKVAPWRPILVQQKVSVRARLITFDHGRSMPLASGTAVEPGQWIEFRSLLGGIAPSSEYRTEWRITNTGPVARFKNALRGEFNPSITPHRRREELTYRGVHMAEAFMLRIVDNHLVGASEPFYVVIE